MKKIKNTMRKDYNFLKCAKVTIFPILFAFAFFHPTNVANVNADDCMNGIWIEPWEDPSSAADKMIAGNINLVMFFIGRWNTDGTINYYNTDTEIKDWMSIVRAKSSNFKILGMVNSTSWESEHPDVGNPTTRATMINQIAGAVTRLGFDGWNEDTEILGGGTKQDLITLWNGMDDRLKSMGKISSADVMVWSEWPADSIAPYVHLDYLIPMCYNGGGHSGDSLKNCMNDILTNSISNVIVGLRAKAEESGTVPLPPQFPDIDALLATKTYSKLKGYTIWNNQEMNQGSYWDEWNNWPTKSSCSGGGPTPTGTPTPTSTPAITILPTPTPPPPPPCVPNGCGGGCPANCTGLQDPDCPGTCIDSKCATDTDCSHYYDEFDKPADKVFHDLAISILALVGGLAFLIIVISGVYMITSSGDPEKMILGKKILTYAIIGIIIVLISYAILVAIEKIAT